MLKRIFGRFKLNTLQKLRAIMDPVEQGEKRAASDDPVTDNHKKQKVEGKLDRKRKCAILFGYNGKGYLGLQRNPGCKTIEEDLCKALLDAELIPVEHFEYMQKMSFQRAARTDKGVSAAGNLVSLKENLVDEINKRLPAQIRVYDCFRTTQGFNSKNHCDARTYIYVLPTYAFLHKDKPLNLEFRMDADLLEKANDVLDKFRGTHNFHNYTSGITATDNSAKRFIIDFECRLPFIRHGVEFCVIAVKGQSFMMHQIRKMVGTMIAVLKGYVEEDFIDRTFNHDKICLPKVPGLGLVLDKLHYYSYNKRFGATHRVIDFELIKDKTNAFKEEYVLSEIYKTEVEEYSMLKWLPELESFTFEIDKEKDREKNITEEKMQQKEMKLHEIEAYINEHNSGLSNTGNKCDQIVSCDNASNQLSDSKDLVTASHKGAETVNECNENELDVTQSEANNRKSAKTGNECNEKELDHKQSESNDSNSGIDKDLDNVKAETDGTNTGQSAVESSSR